MTIIPYLPFLGAAIGVAVLLWGIHWFLLGRHPDLGNDRKFPRQILMLGLGIFALLALILALPVSESARGQLIGLIGLLISGFIAFSSSNILANLMAGILLRITKPFRIGDFIRAGDHFGRVSERGLFDTEIQSECRELIALPNIWLINNPVTTIRSSGVVVSVSLSLGFDVHHSRIEPLLVKAAEESGLEEPFVHITEIGNFAVTYRVSGFLVDIKRYITARSNLCRGVLDVLHGHDIEILSPNFVHQRRFENAEKFIPAAFQPEAEEKTVNVEDLVFDKAEQAERVDQEKQKLTKDIEHLKLALKEADEDGKAHIKENIEEKRNLLKSLEQTEEASGEDNAESSGFASC
ncbi:MAG: mechanosensitive ion channel [Pirellulaceae bacterium]|nr:mechanosensitive ion channel [Pirellulaceae bacterium]